MLYNDKHRNHSIELTVERGHSGQVVSIDSFHLYSNKRSEVVNHVEVHNEDEHVHLMIHSLKSVQQEILCPILELLSQFIFLNRMIFLDLTDKLNFCCSTLCSSMRIFSNTIIRTCILWHTIDHM